MTGRLDDLKAKVRAAQRAVTAAETKLATAGAARGRGMIERLEEIERDLRADAKSHKAAAARIEEDAGKDKGYGVEIGMARAFTIAADRIAAIKAEQAKQGEAGP